VIPVPLEDARDESRYGGKAVQLGQAVRAGLPVPSGFACGWELVAAAVEGAVQATAAIEVACAALAGSVAVRSSAIGEDSAAASFAGQHATVINVRCGHEILEAVATVHASATTDAALAYRDRVGVVSVARMGVIVQCLVDPICAGVLFTRDPLSGADVRVIEASWGLGEAVVAGIVSPDLYRLDRAGHVLEQVIGEKDVAVRVDPTGGTVELPVEAHLVSAPCLDSGRLRELNDLAGACERAFEGVHDIEWAIATDGVFLLQRRPITRLAHAWGGTAGSAPTSGM
jgi:pyruvate,water dikinase